MISRSDSAKRDALWKRYWAIKDAHGNSFYKPILWHLALGGDSSAMVTLADTFEKSGRMSDRFNRSGLYRRADRGGYEYAAQHLAMDVFNRGDLGSYRFWLRRAARFDPEYAGSSNASRHACLIRSHGRSAEGGHIDAMIRQVRRVVTSNAFA